MLRSAKLIYIIVSCLIVPICAAHEAVAKQNTEFSNLHIIDHPLVQHKLTLMRMKETNASKFRQLLFEVGMLMGYEVTKNLPTKPKTIETPLAAMQAPTVNEKDVIIVPILRAGLGMSDGLFKLMPTARGGHIGLYRDEKTKKAVEYLVKLPEAKDRIFILVDPMLATANTANYAVNLLLKHGVKKSNIIFMALVAAPEGVKAFNKSHSDIPLYIAALDDHLDENAYIVPGLGDAGDRIFGTKE